MKSTPQMPIYPRAGQKAGWGTGLPWECQEPNRMSHHLPPPRVCISSQLRLDTNPDALKISAASLPSHVLTTRLRVGFHSEKMQVAENTLKPWKHYCCI